MLIYMTAIKASYILSTENKLSLSSKEFSVGFLLFSYLTRSKGCKVASQAVVKSSENIHGRSSIITIHFLICTYISIAKNISHIVSPSLLDNIQTIWTSWMV